MIIRTLQRWSIGGTPLRRGGGMYLPVYFPDLPGFNRPRRVIWLSLN